MNLVIQTREVAREGPWCFGKGTGQNALPIFVRFNTAIAQYAAHPELAFLVEICVRIQSPTALGLPDEADLEQTGSIEEALENHLYMTKKYLPAGVITGEGYRRFLYYTPDEKATDVARFIQTVPSGREVAITVSHDPEWNRYMSLMPCPVAREGSIEEFWKWFSANQENLSHVSDQNHPTVPELGRRIRAINDGLAFEITVEELQQLAISADCDPSLFPLVEEIIAAAPKYPSWEVKAFRQRTSPSALTDFAVVGDGIKLSAQDIRFTMDRNSLVDLVLYLPDAGNVESQRDMAMIFVQQSIGEYDLTTKIGKVDFRRYDRKAVPPYPALPEMAEALDGLWLKGP